jgi:uncharacterized protein (DUF488 family)
MYYRRRILLGIIEKSGGKLYRTELEKLLFLFCQVSGKDYYNFFPYKYGCYSFISYQDYGKLFKDGYLQEDDQGRTTLLKTADFEKIKKSDQNQINEVMERTRNYCLNELISMIYRDYPFYASKSEILEEKLGKLQAEELKSKFIGSSEVCLIGKGYEGITIDRYLRELISENIQLVIDVRKNPVSMKYNFNKNSLKTKFAKVGISYIHIPKLGIASALRKHVSNQQEHLQMLDNYDDMFLPQAENELEQIRELQKKYNRVALLCFEKDAKLCHRTRIIRRLTQK